MSKELFSVREIEAAGDQTAELHPEASLQPLKENLVQISCKARDLLNHIFDELKPDTHIDFVTAGALSIHQILQYALTITGPADVYISSWTVKEEPARVLHFLKQEGKIRNLYGIFDYRIKTLDAKHFQLLEGSMTKFALTKNHAKVMVIAGKTISMAIVSSANLSNNPRIEAGYISTSGVSVEFHKNWMLNVLNGKQVY